MNRRGLCYSMVYYRKDADQCYEHEVDFLRQLSRRTEVHLIVERGGEAPHIERVASTHLLPSGRIRRTCLYLLTIGRLHQQGIRRFFARNSLLSGLGAGLLCRLGGGKSYLWSCGELKHGWRINRAKTGAIRARTAAAAFVWSARMAEVLVTGNPTMCGYFNREIGLDNGSIAVIPNWIDADGFAKGADGASLRRKLEIPPDQPVILFPRSLSQRHGTRKLPEIFRALQDAGISPWLLATGAGPLTEFLRQRFRELGIDQFLRLPGGVPNREMRHHFDAANVVIVPSDTEGFPRVLLEAMACRRPFVAAEVGGVPDIATDQLAYGLVAKDDIDGYAQKIKHLLENTALRQKLITAGTERLEDFSVERVVDRYVDLFGLTAR